MKSARIALLVSLGRSLGFDSPAQHSGHYYWTRKRNGSIELRKQLVGFICNN